MRILIVILLGLTLCGCAGVKIFDKDGEKGVGYTFHSPKPYLLIERKVINDTLQEKATLVYLPDLANPQTIKLTRGFGSANYALGFENGMLKSISAGSDAKVPEAVGAAAAFLPGGAAILTALKEAKVTAPAEGGASINTSGGQEENGVKLPTWKLYELLTKDGELVLKKVEFEELYKDQ